MIKDDFGYDLLRGLQIKVKQFLLHPIAVNQPAKGLTWFDHHLMEFHHHDTYGIKQTLWAYILSDVVNQWVKVSFLMD